MDIIRKLFAGFENPIDTFQQEEVEIKHSPRLDDAALRELGVVTIGGRMGIRDAATLCLQFQEVMLVLHWRVLMVRNRNRRDLDNHQNLKIE